MCWFQGGRIELLTSVFVRCSRTDAGDRSRRTRCEPHARIDRGAWPACHEADVCLNGTVLLLLAGFNLMWFSIQLVFCVLTDSDDWTWLLHVFNSAPATRYSLVGAGAFFYVMAVRYLRTRMRVSQRPPGRTRFIVSAAWLSAGAIACVTAVFDPNGPGDGVAQGGTAVAVALDRSPVSARSRPAGVNSLHEDCPAIGISPGWIAAAVVSSVLSIAFWVTESASTGHGNIQ